MHKLLTSRFQDCLYCSDGINRGCVHTALNDVTGIETKSEGEGLYKQVRVISKRKRY